jgi:hypothetical protein
VSDVGARRSVIEKEGRRGKSGTGPEAERGLAAARFHAILGPCRRGRPRRAIFSRVLCDSSGFAAHFPEGQLEKVVYSDMTSTRYSSVEQDYSGGAARR